MENNILSSSPIIDCSHFANCKTKKLEEQHQNLHVPVNGEPNFHMESINIKDLVIPKISYKKHVAKIICNFKKAINREIPRNQEENLKKLASLFLNDVKTHKPIVVNLDIGQGKSTLLLEFIKYIHEVDSTFSTVIVKKTLQEGRDFCIKTGLKNNEKIRGWVDSSDDPIKRLEDLYHGDSKDYKESGYDDEFPHEDVFVAGLLRGFNYKDCIEYEDPYKNKSLIGRLDDSFREYSPDLCKSCLRTCGAKLSKWTVDKHPAMVITHQRLFLSNDSEKIIETISGRKVLIIDEKIETKDIGSVLLDQWESILTKVLGSNLSEETKVQFRRIGLYLNGLQYPDRSDGKIIEIPPYNPQFQFDGSVYGILVKDYLDIADLEAIEKFINYGGTTSRSWRNNDKKQFSYIRYINLENYSKHFEKTIILDATSARNGEILDEDYRKSKVVFLGGLHQTDQGNINLYHSSRKTSKNALIISDNAKSNKEKNISRNFNGDRDFYRMNVDLIANEVRDIITESNEKTLIICYKSIVDRYGNQFKFEEDLKSMLNEASLDSKLYSVKHFGAVTTGVNEFRDYKNIIFVGLLNKGKLYYKNTSIAIGSGSSVKTELSEHVISCIQQIGRICVRNGQEANVFMLFEDKLGLTNELQKHYTINKQGWIPKYFNGINNATIAKQKTCWYAVIHELEKLKDGDEISLNSLKKSLEFSFKADTVYRQLKDHHVLEFMVINSITYCSVNRAFMRNIPKVEMSSKISDDMLYM